MNTLKLEMENCYGIQKIQQDIDFSKNNVAVIYAPNGTMKSSFAKTFEAIRDGLLASDLWIDTGFHCGEGLEVLVDDKWVRTRMEMNPAREWYLVGTSYCGDLEYVQARIPE